MVLFKIISAICNSGGIGYKNNIPWKNSKDLEFFKNMTKGNIVIMGYNTFISLGCYPLPQRYNFIIVKKPLNNYRISMMDSLNEIYCMESLNETLKYIQNLYTNKTVYVIGGEAIYNEAIKHDDCQELILTRINEEYNCDKKFPTIPSNFIIYKTECLNDKNNTKIEYWKNISINNSSEYKYLKLLNKILDKGEKHIDRTLIGTLSLFGQKISYNIKQESDGVFQIPCLTTKKIFFKGVIIELLWFLKGLTNAKWLQEHNVNIWDANSSSEFIKKRGLDYEEGQCGPIYGKQWIDWDYFYQDSDKNWIKGKGINQIEKIIDLLRNEPQSRRIVISAWNVADLDKMTLVPCHILYMFSVTNFDSPKPTLNCSC